jgi:methylenetetrahydrofolate dehydrogenase (NADP+)/methenyltetrahydrofolate cyclohydrolase
MEVINGLKLAGDLLKEIKVKVDAAKIRPRLDIVFVGDNEASKVYVQKKIQAGHEAGIEVELHYFQETTTAEISNLIKTLAEDTKVHGIIVQLPAPGIDLGQVLPLIPLHKDVDGLNPFTLGKLWQDQKVLVPATVKAIIKVFKYIADHESLSLESYLTGKNILIINRSLIIGKPLAAVLLSYNATVTIAHSLSRDFEQILSTSDIVISGTGKSGFMDSSKLKSGAVLIDAGFSKTAKKINGDVDISKLNNSISYLSPVPNGIGPLGVACLLENTFEAATTVV